MPSTTFNTTSQPPPGPYQRFSPAPCVVLLNGFPGVGKFTIANAVSEKMGKYNLPRRVIDNHLLIDPVFAIEPVQNVAHYEMRNSIRRTAIEGLKNIEDPELVIMFTATLSTSDQPTSSDDMDQLKEYVELAEARKVPLVVINLVCDLKQNIERLCDEKRKHGRNTKLVDVGTLEKLRSETSLLGRKEVLACRDDIRTVYCDLDISEMNLVHERETVWEILCEVR
jgi:hypothetical protein